MEKPPLYKFDMKLYSEEENPEILFVIPPHLKQQYSSIFSSIPGASITTVSDNEEEIYKNLKGKHALINCPRYLFSKKVLDATEGSLRWVHSGGAGVEHFLFQEFVNNGVVFTNGRVIQGPECADHALALLLALTRRLNFLLKGNHKNLPRPIELLGKKALVIGAGGIGLCIAERANAFGMRVSMVNPDYVPMLIMIESVIRPKDLLEALPAADVVFMAAPHTSLTHHMMSEKEFAAMKEGSYFINVSRGGTVDTKALINAVKTEKFGGIGIDVTDPEPLANDHVLRSMDNVIITPHIAGLSECNRDRSFEVIEENIKRFIDGRPLVNVVDKTLGY